MKYKEYKIEFVITAEEGQDFRVNAVMEALKELATFEHIKKAEFTDFNEKKK